jgi:hypothetical protein
MWEKKVVNGLLEIWDFGGGWRKSFVGRGLGGENLGDGVSTDSERRTMGDLRFRQE